MDFRISIVGFVVGLLVGLTGMGGGALMTPALILLGLANPAIAVGTDLVWGTLTKAVGAFVHCRQKTVDFTIVRCLAVGSIPGALAGLVLLASLHRHHGVETMDRFVVRTLAIALMCVALSLFIRAIRGPRIKAEADFFNQNRRGWVTPVVGAVIGFLVSLTSVGSGSLIVACLVILYPSTSMRRIVGSDIVHGLFLVGVSAFGHLGIGSVDVSLLGVLLVGSIPGVWLGSKMNAVVPERILQPLLATTLFFLGFKLM
jgi:uncharacterized membrane protein YfcA